IAFSLLLYKSIVYKRSTGAVILYLIIIYNRILFSKYFGNGICEHRMICKALMALNDLNLRIFTHNNEVTGLDQQCRFISGRKIDDLYGFVCHFILWNMNKSSFFGKGSI